MDGNILAIRKYIDSIEEILLKIEVSQDKKENQGIDIGKIDGLAKQNPFNNHFINSYDEDIRIKYCTILASYVQYAETVEKKVKQYYFLSRIMNCKRVPHSLEEIITSSEIIGISDFEKLHQELKENTSLLVFDIVLMLYLDGKFDDKQLDYLCETLAYLGTERKAVDSIMKACACILKHDDEKEVLKYAADIPVAKLSCYLESPIKGDVVADIKDVRKSKEQYVTIAYQTIRNVEIDIDTFGKEKIKFYNCRFEKISSIKAKKTKVEFEFCYFWDCTRAFPEKHGWEPKRDNIDIQDIYEGALFAYNEAYFESCIFERCGQSYHSDTSGMLSCKKGNISNCIFKECFVHVNSFGAGSSDYTITSLLTINKVSISGCSFLSCQINGNENGQNNNCFESEYLSIIYCQGGNVEYTKFSDCVLSGISRKPFGSIHHDYILNISSATQRENSFNNCTCVANINSKEWGGVDDE